MRTFHLSLPPILSRHRQGAGSVIFTLCCGLLATGCYSAKDYIARGDQALAKQQIRDAMLDYQKAIQKDGQSSAAFERLGALQARLSDFRDAAANLEKALQLAPDNDALRSELADAALALYMTDPRRPQIRYEQVTKLYRQLLAKDPKSFDGLRFEAALLYVDNQVDRAIEVFRQANAVKPMMADVVLPLADALHKSGQDREAESLATEFMRGHKDVLLMYDWLYAFYDETGRPGQAEAILLQKVANNPTNSAVILQLATHYHLLNKPVEMSAALDKLIQQPKTFPNRFMLVGDFYTGIKEWEPAIRWLTTGIKEDSMNATAYRKRMVVAYLGKQQPKEAVHLLDDLIQEKPDDWASRAQRAGIWIAGKDKEEVVKAVAECQQLVKAQPQDPRLKFLLGRAYFAWGNKTAASQAFAQAAAQQRQYLDPRLALANLDRQASNYRETLRLADEILAIDPNNFEGRLLHASGARGMGNLDAAQRELDGLAREAPQNPDVLLEMGLLTLARKQYAAAERVFTALYQSSQTDMRALAALVSTYLAQGQAGRALQMVNTEVGRLPESIEARELLAAVALTAGKSDIALEQYHKLLQMAPNAPKYYVALADLFRQKSDYGKEIDALQKARKLSPDDAIVAGRLAIAEDLSGNKQEAAAEYKRSQEMAPSDPVLLNNRAFFLAEDGGNLDDALAYSQAAVRKLPNNPGALDTLAWVYTKRKNNDSAIEILNKLVQQNPDVAAFHYHLGTALAQKGDRIKAKAELAVALTKTPTADEKSKITDLMGKLQ